MGKTHFVLLVTVLLVDVTQSVSTRSGGKPTNIEVAWERFSAGDYLFGKPNATWEEAKSLCRSYGGKLLEIEDRTERESIVERLMDKNISEIWVGGKFEDGKWQWASTKKLVDPKIGDLYNYDYDAGEEHCLEIQRDYDYHLNDADCNVKKRFTCEKSR
ncbi:hypothetical protein BsWGS_08821 [Bradybaena similaris]